MRSGLSVARWLMLLASCAHFSASPTAVQAVQFPTKRPLDQSRFQSTPFAQPSLIQVEDESVAFSKRPGRSPAKPIKLVDYPQASNPQRGLGYSNPWQSDNHQRGTRDANESVPLNSDEDLGQSTDFRNSGPQIRRVRKPMSGHSAPRDEGDWKTTREETPHRPDHFDWRGNQAASHVVPSRRAPSSQFGDRPAFGEHEVHGDRPVYGSVTRGRPPIIASSHANRVDTFVQNLPEFESMAFPAESRRNIITPPDWNPTAARVPPVRSDNFFRQQRGVTVIPDSQTAISPRGYSQPIQTTEYTEAYTELPMNDIPLRPGQALPGFRERVTRSSRSPILDSPHQPPSLPEHARDSELPRQSVSEALQFLITATEREVAGLSPGHSASELQYYIERHVYLRLLNLMAGQSDWALRPIPNIPTADQEFWTQVLWGVHSYFNHHQVPDPTARAAQTITQFNLAILRLKERAPLVLKNVIFSHKIAGFGEYETYPKDEFAPGQRILVYAEIGNFHSELTEDGMYRTRIKSALQFFSADNPDEPLESKTYPVTEDLCRNHRRDFFHSYVVDIPARCGQGRHMLNLIIEDELSGKTAEFPLEFNVR
jgi:hypothetical protein